MEQQLGKLTTSCFMQASALTRTSPQHQTRSTVSSISMVMDLQRYSNSFSQPETSLAKTAPTAA